ncbi:Sulfite reductase [NADPH] flavoprotein alpha-component [Pandoraea terrae]|uniref:Sulfite reductase [NADPH] flavoprotein alpha-component n=1 Tax=Pandoraea terrae TaxID=1537710 RepID=A0A5E4SCA2_9BURK|nr:PepSY-associated TM helix domain-containing protein [Pandoraea terrae]VVD73260.1 Sulfite reductase [NADPH] flavoprotein alpha-component [Pandoraea terrae]
MRKLWSRLHWFVGITAGLVLAVVGLTGALLSYEDALTKRFSPGVMTVPVRDAAPLPPAGIYARVQAAEPGRRILFMGLSPAPGDAVSVRLSMGDSPRGEEYFVDPYTGKLLGQSAAADVFLFIRRVHRWLAVEGIGKQITGISVLLLIGMALTGLYLRWPRRPGNWRAWFHIDFKRTGRSFLWNLHAVIGTIVLVPYLMSSFTGLYWSYDWYRSAMFSLAGVPEPARAKPAAKPAGEERHGEKRAPLAAPNLTAAWDVFTQAVPAYEKASVRMPERPGAPLQITYLDAGASHDRAFDRMNVDAQSGAIVSRELYAQKSDGGKFMMNVSALHRGSFFGQPGIIIMGLSSLTMPLFAITGWMLYLDRRKKKRQAPASRALQS